MASQNWISGILLLIFLISCGKSDWKPADVPLKTRWTKDVSPEKVWPQYPRPMMERKIWKNLNGLWEYAIRSRESDQPELYDGKILVPFPIESSLSGVAKFVKEDSLIWYRTYFEIPSNWEQKRIILHFEAVDWETKIWLNQKEIGNHKGGYDPFNFDITKYVNDEDKQELVISVWDPTDKSFQPRGKQVSNPGGIFYTPTSGIWQTVWLEPVPQSSIKDIKLIPDIDQEKITLTVNGVNFQADDQIQVTAFDKNGKEIISNTGKVEQSLELKINNPNLWSPDSPYLYDLTIKLIRKAETLDEVQSYFGMRKISLGKDNNGITRILLNNKFVFQIGPLDQGFWPDGIYTPPTEEAMKYDLEIIKKIGFNMLRKHVKIESRRFYYLCDELGLLVWQDMPNGDRHIRSDQPDLDRTVESSSQFEFELTKLINTKINHPSIVMWVPFNEGWGQYDTQRIVNLIKKMDPTRLVDNASGWTDRGVGDVIDIHRYPGPAAPPPEQNRAAVLGEFGGLGFNMPGHTWQKEGWGYALLQDKKTLTDRYEKLLRSVYFYIDDPGLSAAIYTQTTDIETENNGLMTYDREIIKIDPDVLTKTNKGYLPAQLTNEARIFIDEYEVNLISQKKNAQIYYSLDGSEPNKNSSLFSKPFQITESFIIKSRVFWQNGIASRVNSFAVDKVKPEKAAVVSDLKPGINADYFEGDWRNLPDFSKLAAAESKISSQMDLSVFSQKEDYALRFDGFVQIPKTGVYVFYLNSDDGSRMFINDRILIDNDGIHGNREKSGYIALESGYHPLTVLFFQRKGGQFMKVSYQGPGINKQELTDKNLYHD